MKNCTLEINETGIIIAHYKKELEVGLDTAKELLQQRLAFQQGQSYPLIIHVNGINMTKEARLYMGKDGTAGISIGAFIVKNQLERVMFNFFMVVEKPPVPTRGFTTEKAALNWIHKKLLVKQG